MDTRKSTVSIHDAKSIDLVNYLRDIGFEPSKVRGNNYWFLSPLRTETEPSFKVDIKLNLWYDHGLGIGGTLIDFAKRYHDCTIPELLQMLSGENLIGPGPALSEKNPGSKEHKIKIIHEQPLRSPSLLAYLQQRRIPLEIAREFCVEIRYEIGAKTYYGIGFKNDLGGYEIRNPYFKSSSSPKTISTFTGNSEKLTVFEGFMDFLSFRAMVKNMFEATSDYLVLNSVSFFERARQFMESHQHIALYLDRDQTGRSYTERALSIDQKYTDASTFYKNFKDLNEYWVDTGHTRKKHIGRKL